MLPKGSSMVMVTLDAVPAGTDGDNPVIAIVLADAGRTVTVCEPVTVASETTATVRTACFTASDRSPDAVTVCTPTVRSITPTPNVCEPESDSVHLYSAGRVGRGSVHVNRREPG